jgi:pilus assembly protein CpaB
MTRRRRAAALLGLALLLGVLAASDVAGREAALRRQLGRPVPVVVVARPLAAGQRIARAALAVRHVPERYAPRNALADPSAAVGQRVAVAIPPATDLDPAMLGAPGDHDAPAGPTLRRGERAFDLVAVSAPEAVQAGTRVDVLVTYDGPRGGPRDGPGATRIALEGAEVLESQRAPDEDADAGLPRVRATLRVSVHQAVGLAAAVAAAHEVRLLPRPPG